LGDMCAMIKLLPIGSHRPLPSWGRSRGSRVPERSNKGWLLDLGRGIDLRLGFCLEELANTSRETSTNLGRSGLFLLWFLLLKSR
jgi:hypothetical protein